MSNDENVTGSCDSVDSCLKDVENLDADNDEICDSMDSCHNDCENVDNATSFATALTVV